MKGDGAQKYMDDLAACAEKVAGACLVCDGWHGAKACKVRARFDSGREIKQTDSSHVKLHEKQ